MALFSDIDWIIVLGVGGFLLFGRDGGATVRQLGRWYGRALRLKQELVGEFARAADLPMSGAGPAGSLRAALLGLDAPAQGRVGIPAAVTTAPQRPSVPENPAPLLPSTGGYPVTSWSATFFAPAHDPREFR